MRNLLLQACESRCCFAGCVKDCRTNFTTFSAMTTQSNNRELKQPRRRRQQKPHKFAYLTMKNSIFARFARAFFIFWHFEDVNSRSFYDVKWHVLLSCGRREHMLTSIQFCLLMSQRWFQFNSRIVRTHFSSIVTLNNWKMIVETRSYIFRWRSRLLRRRVCLISLIGSLRSTTRLQRRRHKICILNWQKQKFCTPFKCFF